MKELVRQKVTEANASDIAVTKDATFEPDVVTLAFSDRVRAFAWVTEPLAGIPLKTAQSTLCGLHFLTVNRKTLADVVDGDSQAYHLVLANANSATAQLDASKSSKLYTGGRISTARHVYESACNLRLFFSVMVPEVGRPLVVQKIMEYVDLLMSRPGRLWFERHADQPHLALHPWQDIQHILSAFLTVATTADLYQAVMRGGTVGLDNYASALAVANRQIADVRAIFNGNGMMKFAGTPETAAWFVVQGGTRPSRDRTEPTRDGDTKRPKLDPAELERKKGLGILEFDATVAGSAKLPISPAYAKKRGSKTPERLCMKFLTRGHACTNPNCRFPHVSNVSTLPEAERQKLDEFVRKQPGLSWVSGKEPTGTN